MSVPGEEHDGIVLDNVNSWGQLLAWRAVLQARNTLSKGGQSATNIYSYAQYLYGVAIVATVEGSLRWRPSPPPSRASSAATASPTALS